MSLSKEIQDFVANYDAAEKNAITKEHNASISKYYEEQAKSNKALKDAQAAYYNSKAAAEPSAIFANNRYLPGEGPTAIAPTAIEAPTTTFSPPEVETPVYPTTTYPTNDTDPEDRDVAYLGGGTVRPTAGPSRPDRVAQAQPGVGIPEASHGTMPGGNTTAAIASSPGYEGGGPSPAPQAIQEQPAQEQPAPEADTHPMLNGLEDAINSGAKYLHDKFSLAANASEAVPTRDNSANLRRFHSGDGAASAADHAAVSKAVDPNNQLKESLRDAAGLNAVYQHYLKRGDYNKASQAAGALILHLRNVSSKYGNQAVTAIKNGDLQGGLDNTKKAFDKVPNGTSLEGNVNRDGTVNLAEKDHAGRTITQSRLTPQQLLTAATGLKNGTGYFQVLQAAAGKKGASAGAGSAAAAGKVPTAQQNAAFQNWVQNGGTTEPPIASFHKSHINPALSLYRVRMKNEGGSGAGASGGALKVEKRSDLDDDMTKALGDYNESLPKDVKLAESHMAPLQSAATHIVTGTGLGPKEAFRAADDLSDPTNPAIDKGVPMKNGAIAVRLRSGTTLPLTEDAFNHVMAYRKQRIHEDSIKAGEFGKKQEQALKVNDDWQTIKEAVGGLSDSTKNWMQKQWADYQASKGAQ